MKATAAFALCLLALVASACSNSTTTSPSTTTTSPTSPVTDTFASLLAVHGTTVRSFTTTNAGSIKVTLATLGNGTLTAGVAVGVRATGAPCSPAVSVVTGPGGSPQVVTSADAGTYCVQVFDNGSLREDTPFSVVIEHP